MNELDTKYMKEAIKQAKKALKLKEVPIGCVIVYQDKIIARGYNRRNTDKTTLGHAEITAIKKPAALSATGGWKTVRFILHLNRARCAPGQLYRHGFQGLLSAR